MKEGIGLTKMQKEKLKKFLVEEAEDIGMTSRHANKKSPRELEQKIKNYQKLKYQMLEKK
jgi:hypothetical protein